MDNLQQILDKQLSLQQNLGYFFDYMSEEQLAAYIKEYSLHLMVELGEMLKELPHFKPWKKYPEPDYSKVYEEFADVVHFFANIAIALGLSSDRILEMYMDKHNINEERQLDTNNYKKCSYLGDEK